MKRVIKSEKALGKHVINLYSTRISQMIKIKDVKKLQQDIDNDHLESIGLLRLPFSAYFW